MLETLQSNTKLTSQLYTMTYHQHRRNSLPETSSSRDGTSNFFPTAQKQRRLNLVSTSIPFTFNSPQSQYIPNNQQPTSDEWEYTVIKFGSEISLRGRLGKYLTVIPGQQPSVTPVLPVAPANLNSSRSSFSVADGGQVI